MSKNKYGNGVIFKDIKAFTQQYEIIISTFEKNHNFLHLVTKIYNNIVNHLRMMKIKYDLLVERSITTLNLNESNEAQSSNKHKKSFSLSLDNPNQNFKHNMYPCYYLAIKQPSSAIQTFME